MVVPTLLYSFFLFLKLAVRLGLTWELVSAWPLWIGLIIGINLYKLDNLLSVFSYPPSLANRLQVLFEHGSWRAIRRAGQLSVKGLSVFSLPVLKQLINRKLTNLKPTRLQSPSAIADGGQETENREQITENRSISQNILFAAGWAAAALFGMTSTIGWLGKGVVLGVGLQLAVRVAKDFPHRLDWFYQPIKRQLTESEKKWGAAIFLAVFAVLSFF